MQGIPLDLVSRIDWDKDYGEFLFKQREDKKLSREEVAKAITGLGEPCSQQLIHKIEKWNGKGDRSVSLSLILKYCQVLGIELKDFYPVVAQTITHPLFQRISSIALD
jgi:transcriptional regulator with XRE-family HTH domain